MKNKSKLAKIKNRGNANPNIPEGWFLMCTEATSISVVKDVLAADYEVDIWTEAGVAEVSIGEKSSIDIEALACDLRDEYSNSFLEKNGVKSLFFVSFKKDDYEMARPVLEKLSAGVSGFVCGDTDDFLPRI